MRQSELVRDKWEREDYLPRTILSACAQQANVLQIQALPLLSQITKQIEQTNPNIEWFEVNISDIYTNPPKPPMFLIEDILPAEAR